MMHEGAKIVAEEKGFDLIYLAPTKPYNLEEQTRLVDDLIEKKVDGIVLVPVDSAGIVPAIERANAAGIPVALANQAATGGDTITLAAIENYDAMTLVAEWVAEKLGHEGKVVFMEGPPGNQTPMDRLRALNDVFGKYEKMEILASQNANSQRAEGMQLMENWLQMFPEIDAVLCINDEMALGAIEALDAAGRLEETLVAGFDANNDALKAVYDGRMAVTCDQQPFRQSGDALLALLDHLAGKSVEKRIKIPGFLVDKETVMEERYLSRIQQ
jgi:ribose transport system substrate-binding protein